MRKTIFTMVLAMLFATPSALHAEEIEIQLMEVVELIPLPGDAPLDDAEHMGSTPTRPNNFRATINGTTLSIEKQEEAIPSAQAIVVNAASGNVVLNQQFTNSLTRQIANTGVYVLRIETAGGTLVGQFNVL